MGQLWDLVCILLVNLGYITKSHGKRILNYTKFENLQQINKGDLEINVYDSHPKGEVHQYFICCGKPMYSGSTKENNVF